MRLFELFEDAEHSFDDRLNPELRRLLSQSAAAYGLTIGNRSGVRPYDGGPITPATQSGRHTHGNGMDVELYRNGELLSVNNPEQSRILRQFTGDFISRARASGFQPSVGWGTNYMSGNAGHFDIAAGLNSRPDGRAVGAGYWGNGQSASGAVDWLPGLFNNPGDFRTDLPDIEEPDTYVPPPSLNITGNLPPPGTSTYNLRTGSEGEQVRSLQTALNDLGFSAGSVDGNFGRNTAAAVRSFQRSAGIDVDGIAGDQTMAALRAARPTTPTPSELNISTAKAASAGSSLAPSSSPRPQLRPATDIRTPTPTPTRTTPTPRTPASAPGVVRNVSANPDGSIRRTPGIRINP